MYLQNLREDESCPGFQPQGIMALSLTAKMSVNLSWTHILPAEEQLPDCEFWEWNFYCLWWISIYISTCWGGREEWRRGSQILFSSAQWQDKRQWVWVKTIEFHLNIFVCFVRWGWWNIGAHCSVSLWSHHQWRYSKPDWMLPWTTCSEKVGLDEMVSQQSPTCNGLRTLSVLSIL